MRLSPISPAGIVVLALYSLSLAAQNYHLEVPDGDQGVRAKLFNDSDKVIEAFHWFDVCPTANGPRGSMDALDGPGGTTSEHAADGTYAHGGVIPPGGWVDMRSPVYRNAAGEDIRCERKLDAIVFQDGTFEGDQQALRFIAEHRAAVLEAVRNWVDRLKNEPEDGSTLETLRLGAEHLREIARKNIYDHHGSIAYWSGCSQVQTDFLVWLHPESNRYSATEKFHRLSHFFGEWDEKIANDTALKNLTAAFPVPTDEGPSPQQAGGQLLPH